jgi:hypothetical protein
MLLTWLSFAAPLLPQVFLRASFLSFVFAALPGSPHKFGSELYHDSHGLLFICLLLLFTVQAALSTRYHLLLLFVVCPLLLVFCCLMSTLHIHSKYDAPIYRCWNGSPPPHAMMRATCIWRRAFRPPVHSHTPRLNSVPRRALATRANKSYLVWRAQRQGALLTSSSLWALKTADLEALVGGSVEDSVERDVYDELMGANEFLKQYTTLAEMRDAARLQGKLYSPSTTTSITLEHHSRHSQTP